MESATCCGMELARSAVWNHHEVMYGINPKKNARWRVMPYAYGDYILTCGEIPYQSFGLDNKKGTFDRQKFLFCCEEAHKRCVSVDKNTKKVRRFYPFSLMKSIRGLFALISSGIIFTHGYNV